jgi:glutaredoxin
MRRNILYTTEDCTQSKRLLWLLKEANLNFEEVDMRSKESQRQLKSMGISDPDSPLLVMDDNPLRFLSSNDINSMADKNLLALVR